MSLLIGKQILALGFNCYQSAYGKLVDASNESIPEMSKSIVKGIGIGFLSCIGIAIGIAKTISQVLVLVLVLLRRQPKYWYWYC